MPLPSSGRMQQQIDDRQYRGMFARRYGSYYDKSRGGEHTSHGSGTPIARTSTLGPSAQNQPGASRKKSGRVPATRRGKGDSGIRRGARGRTRPKTVPYRKGGCPPGYRYDRRKKMCVRTSK